MVQKIHPKSVDGIACRQEVSNKYCMECNEFLDRITHLSSGKRWLICRTGGCPYYEKLFVERF